MKSLHRTITTDKPLDQVFAYLSDFTNTEEWDPGTVSCSLQSGDGSVGSVYANTSRFLGRETALTYVVEALEPSHFIKLRGENKTVTSYDIMRLSRDGSQTRLDYTAEFTFKGAARFAEPLLVPALKKLGDDAEKCIRTALARL